MVAFQFIGISAGFASLITGDGLPANFFPMCLIWMFLIGPCLALENIFHGIPSEKLTLPRPAQTFRALPNLSVPGPTSPQCLLKRKIALPCPTQPHPTLPFRACPKHTKLIITILIQIILLTRLAVAHSSGGILPFLYPHRVPAIRPVHPELPQIYPPTL